MLEMWMGSYVAGIIFMLPSKCSNITITILCTNADFSTIFAIDKQLKIELHLTYTFIKQKQTFFTAYYQTADRQISSDRLAQQRHSNGRLDPGLSSAWFRACWEGYTYITHEIIYISFHFCILLCFFMSRHSLTDALSYSILTDAFC